MLPNWLLLLLWACAEMIDRLLNYRTALCMVTGQCCKSVEAPRICVSAAFFISLDSDVFCLSWRTLQFTKYFNITNGNNRRGQKGKEGNKGERERDAMRQSQWEKEKERTPWGLDERDGRVRTRNHRKHTVTEHLYVSASRLKTTCDVWLIFEWMFVWQVAYIYSVRGGGYFIITKAHCPGFTIHTLNLYGLYIYIDY